MDRYQFTIFADYFQFYLEDEGAHPDFSQSWTPDALANLLAFDPASRRGVAIGTVRNMPVPVTLEVHPARPEAWDLADWDQIHECSLDLRSGTLVLLGCTDYYPTAPRLTLAPGTYRLQIGYGGLDRLSDDGLEGDDVYCLRLWPAPYQPPTTLKHRRA